MMIRTFALPASLLMTALVSASLLAQSSTPVGDTARRDAADLTRFEHMAMLSKDLGATHVAVTQGLPLSTWEMDPDDPYPMWFVHHVSLLKIFPPSDVQPYINMKYATRVAGILHDRCEVLSKYGLKGVWNANEPAVMPEAFFTAFPELRGPRIDQPNRSRKAYFAPNVDNPEALRMYRDSMQHLLAACPNIELFNWVTTDAGSGFDWAASLYPGINGNSNYQDRPMSDRVSGFLINAQQAAEDLPLSIAEVVFVGRHIHKSRILGDGYLIDDVVDQIENALSEASEVIANEYMTAIRNPVARLDRLGNLVHDEAILECSRYRPNPDIFSVIPKGDKVKPK